MHSSLLQEIHSYIRNAIYRRAELPEDSDVRTPSKKYPRMRQVPFSALPPLETTLADALRTRRSRREMSLHQPLSVDKLGTLLGYALGTTATDKHRPYASGGGLYPLETYVLVNSVEGLERAVYHYEPDTHALEHLWPMPTHAGFSSLLGAREWSSFASCVLVFTCVWERSSKKYEDFAYLLSLVESGSAGQNIALVAAAMDISVCPIAACNDSLMERVLDLRQGEQVLYTIAVGTHQS